MSNPGLFSLQCESVSEVSALLGTSGWDAQFRQLDCGSRRAHIGVLASHETTLMRVDLGNRDYQTGTPEPGALTFGLPAGPQAPGRIGRRSLESESLTCFDPRNGMDVVSEAGFSAYTLSFSAARLRELAEVMELPESPEVLGLGNRQCNPAAEELNRLRCYLGSVLQLAAAAAGPDEESLHRILDADLPALILNTWFAGRPAPYVAPNNRSRALRKALELIRAQPKSSLTVERLCRDAGCSMSTLERAFRDHFGVSPKRFLIVRRLGGVRDALMDSEETSTIADIASDWGFWHMSKFAADYRSQFGELPTATRIRATS